MIFTDGRARYGTLIKGGPHTRCETMEDLAEALHRAGMAGAVVYNYMADNLGVHIGNDILMKDIYNLLSRGVFSPRSISKQMYNQSLE